MRLWLALVLCSGVVLAGCGTRSAREAATSTSAAPGAAADAADPFGADFNVDQPVVMAPAPASPTSEAPARAATPADESKKAEPVETWKRSSLASNYSRLSIGDEDALPLVGFQADVRVDGFRARVLVDCYYFNDRSQSYEGTFQFRLPNGATPYFCAFGQTIYAQPETKQAKPEFFTSTELRQSDTSPEDILELRERTWQAPKVARMAARDTAALAYRETVRRRVDPALVEWSGAGVFQCRVFPLQPQQLHRVVLGYDVDLTAAGADWELRFEAPPVEHSVIDVSVDPGPQGEVRVTPSAEITEEGRRRLCRYEDRNLQEIVVRVIDPGPVALVGVDEEAGSFFAASISPSLPEAKDAGGAAAGVLMVDVSLSSDPDRFNVWLALLRSILDGNRDRLERFAVVFFNVEAFWWREAFVENTPENVEQLLTFAESLSLEGATDLHAALREAAAPSWMQGRGEAPAWDVFLLSDGAATWGQSGAWAMSKALGEGHAKRLFAYRTGQSGADEALLAHLARESGGALFAVAGESQVAAAAKAHRQIAWDLEEIQIDGAEDVLLAGRPKAIYPGQRLTLAGRGTIEEKGACTLKLRQGETVHSIELPLAGAIASETAPRIYGQLAVGQLEAFEGANQDVAASYARHFRIVGRTCSLVMLEAEEDYQRFHIKPEEDAFVVSQKPAAPLVRQTLESIGETLSSGKRQFLAHLARLEQAPSLGFRPSAAFQAALERMPESAFDVPQTPLACKARQSKEVAQLRKASSEPGELPYTQVSALAESRRKKHGPDDALRALSSLVETRPGDVALLRDVAFSALEWDRASQAYWLFQRTADMRPYEPQSYRAMGQCLAEMGSADLALAWYETAYSATWDARFGEFRKIVAVDYLGLLRRIDQGELSASAADYARARLRTLSSEIGHLGADLVVAITWNTDGTDVDLHVIDPRGEECFYQHRRTKLGGELTADVTQGYGPEMFVLPKAAPGRYQVRVKYFSTDTTRSATRTKVYLTVIKNWGEKSESVERKVVALQTGKEMHEVATVQIGGRR